MTYQAGRHFLQIPGPTNVPDRILRAIAQPVLDHRGPVWAQLQAEVFERIRPVFKTRQPVMIFPASGTGGWESALVNTLSPGDQVLTFDTGQFAVLWGSMAGKLGLDVKMLATDWRRAPSPEAIEAALTEDRAHKIKAVLLVHNETSNGVMSRVSEIRKAIDRAGHPALLMLDTISSLGSADVRMDEWGVDVVVGGSQKGLMLPAGLAFVAASQKARAASKTAKLPRAFWDWEPMLAAAGGTGALPYTPACNLFFGLKEALDMIEAEGPENVFARHARHAEATRRAVRAWGLETVCAEPSEYSQSVTGLGKLADKVFRIGHLGDFNDLMLAGTLSGVEMGLALAKVPHRSGGVVAALNYLSGVEERRAAA
jgi:alanine-glyoxylate transaminase/serine-glyoxylate transaminase/serine-pyruvate transaminase